MLYEGWQVIGMGLIGILTGLALGFHFGREGFLACQHWEWCVFRGRPPEGYNSWFEFLRSQHKTGCFLRATTSEDWSKEFKEGNQALSEQLAKYEDQSPA